MTKLEKRIEELEKRIRELEARPVYVPHPYVIYPPSQPLVRQTEPSFVPFVPTWIAAAQSTYGAMA